ncbi:hypothetical protein [Maribacter sp.]|uniref:hypothetical protein n=1 Tax=Maribacter sp. TaxID=1897614 RepID=UPI0025B9702F|nr:hypothetical protein [Maribacter sp.]
MYIFYMGNDLKGDFFGFKWLSIFLYNFGVEISMIGMGALLWISTRFHSKNGFSKKLFRLIAGSQMAVGFFFTSWIFTSAAYFSKSYEIIFAILIAFFATIISTTMLLFITREIRNIKELKNSFFDYLLEFHGQYTSLLSYAMTRNSDFKEYKEKIEGSKIYDEAHEEFLKQSSDKAEKSVKKTAQKIDDYKD